MALLLATLAAALLLASGVVGDECDPNKCDSFWGSDCCVGSVETKRCDDGYEARDVDIESWCSSAGGNQQYTCCTKSLEDQIDEYGCTFEDATCEDGNVFWHHEKCHDGWCRAARQRFAGAFSHIGGDST